MEPHVALSSITFSDGTTINTSDASIIALVGPNNSGKTSTIREIQFGSRVPANLGPVLKSISFTKRGSEDDLKGWLERSVQKVKPRHGYGQEMVYSWLGQECRLDSVESSWKSENLGNLNSIFCNLIDVEKRLKVADAQEPIDFFSEAPSHPVHVLFKDTVLERKVSEAFRAAFKGDLVLNRGGGKVIAFHVGVKPEFKAGEDALSPSYFKRLCDLPFLHNQGHGMRSFVGCILHIFTSPAFISLVDEPEAFLHPPHSRLLAGLLARSLSKNRQLLIATHSGDFLRGLLDANPPSLRIVRLTREDKVNYVHELKSEEIRALWSDPVLRFSNVLDSIFHDGVVLCEGDGDCRFYSAVLEAVLENSGSVSPDIMFAASGGKDRMPVIIRALLQLGVKIRVIGDFDVLRDRNTLLQIVEALGGDPEKAEKAWRTLNQSIQSQTPPLAVNQVREQINAALEQEASSSLTKGTEDKIKKTLKATSPWHFAKMAGVNVIASGGPRTCLEDFLKYLEGIGLFVVRCGEIERFVPSVGAHGPKWVAEVLAKSLSDDPELETARQFVTNLFHVGPHEGWCQPKREPEPDSTSGDATVFPVEPIKRPTLWRTLLKKVGI